MAVVVVVVVLCYVLIQVRVKCFPLHSGCDMTITSSESTVEPQTNRTHPFNGPFFGTTQMSQYQKGKTNLDFTEARDIEWQWVMSWAMCKSAPRSTQITMPAPHHSVFTGRMPFLSPNQQRQSTEGTTNQPRK